MKTLLILAATGAVLCIAGVAGLWLLVSSDPGREMLEGALEGALDESLDTRTRRTIAANEDSVRVALALYARAQESYRTERGFYAIDLDRLALPAPLIEAAWDGEGSGSARPDWNGYRFVPVTLRDSDPLDCSVEHLLCAVPARFYETGIHTFVAGADGILRADNRFGAFIEDGAELDDGDWSAEPLGGGIAGAP